MSATVPIDTNNGGVAIDGHHLPYYYYWNHCSGYHHGDSVVMIETRCVDRIVQRWSSLSEIKIWPPFTRDELIRTLAVQQRIIHLNHQTQALHDQWRTHHIAGDQTNEINMNNLRDAYHQLAINGTRRHYPMIIDLTPLSITAPHQPRSYRPRGAAPTVAHASLPYATSRLVTLHLPWSSLSVNGYRSIWGRGYAHTQTGQHPGSATVEPRDLLNDGLVNGSLLLVTVTPSNACTPSLTINHPRLVNGSIVNVTSLIASHGYRLALLVDRGGCTLHFKALCGQSIGAAVVIVSSDDHESPGVATMDATFFNQLSTFAIVVSNRNGDRLRRAASYVHPTNGRIYDIENDYESSIMTAARQNGGIVTLIQNSTWRTDGVDDIINTVNELPLPTIKLQWSSYQLDRTELLVNTNLTLPPSGSAIALVETAVMNAHVSPPSHNEVVSFAWIIVGLVDIVKLLESLLWWRPPRHILPPPPLIWQTHMDPLDVTMSRHLMMLAGERQAPYRMNIPPRPSIESLSSSTPYDCGYYWSPKRWADAQGLGVQHDYCRMVGDYDTSATDDPSIRGPWWACHLATFKNNNKNINNNHDDRFNTYTPNTKADRRRYAPTRAWARVAEREIGLCHSPSLHNVTIISSIPLLLA
jgi:hypothetical protein